MKVSSKIILGFLVLMLLVIGVFAYQLSAIREIQSANRELSEINVVSAKTVLQMQKLADLLEEDSLKYFAGLSPGYAEQIADFRSDFLEQLVRLRRTAKTNREQAEAAKLNQALDDFWEVFNRLKKLNQTWDPDQVPPDLTIAANHLKLQAGMMLEAVQDVIRERVEAAGAVGMKAERLAWSAGIVAFVAGVIITVLIVRSITEPLRKLMQGTHVIAKGQFWHRLPVHGNDEFAELGRDFNAMTERLGELDQMKKDFVSHVSHDLKAPLASIRQIMHLLLQGIPGSLNDQQKSLIQLSYNSAERLAAMVGNLLDISRMEAGTMEYRMAAHDIIPLIESVSDEFQVQAREKNIQFKLETEQPAIAVECDRDRIVQVIGNLYENALKFSPSQSEIVTRVGRGKGAEILISVIDSGPGVPDDHKQRIFQKFHQVKHGKKMAGQGVGLGLAISKTIVEAHGGQIWVEDNPNGGSVFSFVLHSATREEVLTCGQTA